MPDKDWDFTGLKAIFFNGTLTKSPDKSHTERLVQISRDIMEKHGIETESIRVIDQDIAVGVWPDMREHGYKTDDWPEIYQRVMAADILVLAGPIWLGDNSSET
jgi:multimeric flavodoxin WrbA